MDDYKGVVFSKFLNRDFKICVQCFHTSKKLIEGDYKRVVLFIILGLRGLMIKRGNVKC